MDISETSDIRCFDSYGSFHRRLLGFGEIARGEECLVREVKVEASALGNLLHVMRHCVEYPTSPDTYVRVVRFEVGEGGEADKGNGQRGREKSGFRVVVWLERVDRTLGEDVELRSACDRFYSEREILEIGLDLCIVRRGLC